MVELITGLGSLVSNGIATVNNRITRLEAIGNSWKRQVNEAISAS